MSRKLVDYKIVSGKYLYEVELEVLCWIKHEWEPIGGVAYCKNYDDKVVQAMVKYEDLESPGDKIETER